MRTTFNRIIVFNLVILALCACLYGQSTTFTYQGRLNDASAPASGSYDLQFSLFDAVSGGGQVGTTQTLTGVNVIDGMFTVELDFGALSFTGGPRFIQVGVKKLPETIYTPLNPRQRITSTPYAMKSLTTVSAETLLNALQLAGLDANQFLTLDTGIRNTNTLQTPANFNISGTGIANLLTANTVNSVIQYNLNGSRYLFGNESSVYIGPDAGPTSAGSISGNTAVGGEAGTAIGSASNNSLFGSQAGANLSQGAGNSFFGRRAGFAFLSGDNNTFIGNAAAGGTSLTAGDGNTFIGGAAGNGTFGAGFNTFVGYESGIDGASTHNSALGKRARINPGLSHATAIGADSMAVNSNSVILGRNAGQDTVEVPGKIKVFQLGAAGSTQLCRNGDNEISGCSSSLRYKNNVLPFTSGLSLMNQLRPISFNWASGGMKDVGFGAEEVAKVDPRLVTYNAKGEVEGVKYDRFSVLFVNAFKEQQAQIETQNRQIESQQKQIDGQKAMIEDLRIIVCAANPGAAVCGGEKK